jgi:hypothetical protein
MARLSRGEYNVGLHEPIIDRKIWDAAAATLKANQVIRRTSRNLTSGRPLLGLLFCEKGGTVHTEPSVEEGKALYLLCIPWISVNGKTAASARKRDRGSCRCDDPLAADESSDPGSALSGTVRPGDLYGIGRSNWLIYQMSPIRNFGAQTLSVSSQAAWERGAPDS